MDLYKFVPIDPSENHHVFFELPIKGEGPPKPFPSHPEEGHWDNMYVKMPHSPSNVDEKSGKKIWEIFSEAFKKFPSNFEELRDAILSYSRLSEEESSFSGLEAYLKSDISSEVRKHLFDDLFPKIISLALKLPEEITKPIPILLRGTSFSLSLSQKQIGVLLSNAFLCTFPPRQTSMDKSGCGYIPDINFNRLFMRKDVHTKEKFKCIFNYFDRITSEEPDGVVTFTRTKVENFIFEACDDPLPDLELKLDGRIEEAKNHLQVDFADEYIGGLIFSKDCSQEEIRFLICPELIITRLFTALLEDEDAIIITGVEQYNKSSGYDSSFNFISNFHDETPRDEFRRRKCQVTAIDALDFDRRSHQQFEPAHIRRELRKAFAGFRPEEGTKPPFTPVATGNWGCGELRGSPYLKSLIQLIAAGAAGRNVTYFTFRHKNLIEAVERLHEILQDKNITVGKLAKLIISYHEVGGKLKGVGLYKYILKKVP